MWMIECETVISASHQLREYSGKCANVHGHNWKVRARLWISELDSRGLSIDFGDVKSVIMKYDHKHLNDFPVFAGTTGWNNPTAENLSRVLYADLRTLSEFLSVKVGKIEVDIWETEKNRVRFEGSPE